MTELLTQFVAKKWEPVPVRVEKISDLRFVWRLYPRKGVDSGVVMNYVKALQAGCVFPPVKIGLFRGKKIIVDGVHRIRSRQFLKIAYMDAKTLPFTSEAELFAEAVRLNNTHGKGFTVKEIKRNVGRLQRYHFDVKDIQRLTHVPASEIRRAPVSLKSLRTPSGKKIHHCNIKNVDCNGMPNTRELLQFKNALQLICAVAQKGCIPKDDPYFKELVTQCRLALGKVRFNG